MTNKTKINLITKQLQTLVMSLIVFFGFTAIALIPNKLAANDLGRKLGVQLTNTPEKGSFALITNRKPASLLYSSNDFVGVAKAISYFKSDLKMVPGLGRTLSAMIPILVNSPSLPLDQNSPRLEYDVLLNTSGEVTVSTLLSPTLNIYNNAGLCFAISLDEQPPQIVNIHKKNTHRD